MKVRRIEDVGTLLARLTDTDIPSQDTPSAEQEAATADKTEPDDNDAT